MTIKARAVRLLLRLYPRPWREEYGPELEALLLARPLDMRVVADVAANGVRASLRNPDPAAACAVVTVAAMTLSAVKGGPDQHVLEGMTRLLSDSGKLLPTTVIAPLYGNAYGLLMVACGCWAAVRDRRSVWGGGRAAALATVAAGIPFIAAGMLMGAGVWHSAAALPSRATWVAIVLTPFFAAAQALVWGMVGAWIARRTYLGRGERART
jgi:hypothetical protein